MASTTDIKSMKWSTKGYPIHELVAKFSLPLLVKSANSSKDNKTSYGIVAHQIYRIKRLLRVQTIRTRIVPSNVPLPSEISIPKDYRGPFQILPFEPSMHNDVSLEDIVQYRPRYIKVVETVSNITTGIHIDLNAGDELEVLGTRKRATKTGVKEYLKLRKQYREFILNPDCQGKFQIVEDETLYTLHDILERFPLPQRVSLVNIESHSEQLLTLVPSGESGATILILKDTVQDEYVVGEDLQKEIRAILHIDAELYFYVPDSISPSYVEKEELQISGVKIDGDGEDDEQIFIDQLIRLAKDNPVVCGAAGEVFQKLVLYPRSASSNTIESQLHSISDTNENSCYSNVVLQPTRSKDVKYGKVGVGLPMLNEMPDWPPPIPPKPPTGEGDKYNVKLLTPEETRHTLTDNNREGPIGFESEPLYDDPYASNREGPIGFESEPLYDDPYASSSDINDEDVNDYEKIDFGEDDFDSDGTNSYIDMTDITPDSILSTNDSIEIKHPTEDENETEYENSPRPYSGDNRIDHPEPPPLPRAITHQEPTKLSAAEDDIPPELPPRMYRSSSTGICDIDPKYRRLPETNISEVYRKSVKGVDRLPISRAHGAPPEPPEPLLRRNSLESMSMQAQSKESQRQRPTKDNTKSPSSSRINYEVHLPPIPSSDKTTEDIDNTTPSSHQQQLPDLVTNEEQVETKSKSSFPTNQEDLRKLSVMQVLKVLENLKFGNDILTRFKEDGIDGELFCSLDEGDLRSDFGLSKFHALKIVKFINGWRPSL